tara:strand:+ start:4646 stop:4786 length:141 start_codon:yes stop_codon:yes gene_type:complete
MEAKGMSSKMKGMAFALRAERKKTKMLEEEVERLRKELTELKEMIQ